MRKLLITRTLATVATAAALAVLPPAETHAGAIGSTPVATFDYQVGGVTMKIPTGCMFTHIIRGEGKNITYQNAGVDCGFVGSLNAGFCNWCIDFTYAD
ncbi:hypothetical protein ABZY44_20895 [Streptomyces sp. NPDC006544]|uniref:hypothetical protein n=1 Tax=Streptomyces sp. NPDC006544 TaxID=3154583 RepID=UPI0033B67891